jgi:hypothetical protein
MMMINRWTLREVRWWNYPLLVYYEIRLQLLAWKIRRASRRVFRAMSRRR